MTSPAISLENLGRSFGSKPAVKGLSLSIPYGEIFGLLGPNGAGKTTVIRMMTGLLMPSGGRAAVGGHDVVLEPVAAKTVMGYVPDRPFLYEKLTARELLIFMASVRGIGKSDAMGRISELLNLVGLEEAQNELIEGYSQGMRQRLLFASALVHRPKVLLIDEPFVGLDPFGVILIRDIIREIALGGAAVFLATHSLHIAAELCDRVGLMDMGELKAIKDKAEIRTAEGGLEGLFIRETGTHRPRGDRGE